MKSHYKLTCFLTWYTCVYAWLNTLFLARMGVRCRGVIKNGAMINATRYCGAKLIF